MISLCQSALLWHSGSALVSYNPYAVEGEAPPARPMRLPGSGAGGHHEDDGPRGRDRWRHRRSQRSLSSRSLGWGDIVLVERDELTAGSTWHAAGNCPNFSTSYNVLRLQAYSNSLYRRLPQETGYPIDHRQSGSIRLAHNAERMAEFHHVASPYAAKEPGAGLRAQRPRPSRGRARGRDLGRAASGDGHHRAALRPAQRPPSRLGVSQGPWSMVMPPGVDQLRAGSAAA
jgi:hypothetical protein